MLSTTSKSLAEPLAMMLLVRTSEENRSDTSELSAPAVAGGNPIKLPAPTPPVVASVPNSCCSAEVN